MLLYVDLYGLYIVLTLLLNRQDLLFVVLGIIIKVVDIKAINTLIDVAIINPIINLEKKSSRCSKVVININKKETTIGATKLYFKPLYKASEFIIDDFLSNIYSLSFLLFLIVVRLTLT